MLEQKSEWAWVPVMEAVLRVRREEYELKLQECLQRIQELEFDLEEEADAR
jgi:hypothetical protein